MWIKGVIIQGVALRKAQLSRSSVNRVLNTSHGADVASISMMLPARLQTPCFHSPHDAALAEYFVAA